MNKKIARKKTRKGFSIEGLQLNRQGTKAFKEFLNITSVLQPTVASQILLATTKTARLSVAKGLIMASKVQVLKEVIESCCLYLFTDESKKNLSEYVLKKTSGKQYSIAVNAFSSFGIIKGNHSPKKPSQIMQQTSIRFRDNLIPNSERIVLNEIRVSKVPNLPSPSRSNTNSLKFFITLQFIEVPPVICYKDFGGEFLEINFKNNQEKTSTFRVDFPRESRLDRSSKIDIIDYFNPKNAFNS